MDIIPKQVLAPAIKIQQKAMALAKSAGIIFAHPFESGINSYSIYITGFWFM